MYLDFEYVVYFYISSFAESKNSIVLKIVFPFYMVTSSKQPFTA